VVSTQSTTRYEREIFFFFFFFLGKSGSYLFKGVYTAPPHGDPW
jgi:hypothetical protein